MKEIIDKIEQSKGNIEIEGVEVPGLDKVEMYLKKYEDKLGPDAVDSLFYALCKGKEICEEEENAKRK